MLGLLDEFKEPASKLGLELIQVDMVQTLSEAELIVLLPGFDGWIIGDDPATEAVFSSTVGGRFQAAVKWGIGVDNVDFNACERLGIPITNTPNMFGDEVADLAVGYLIALARQTFEIDRGVREGSWPKPAGKSITGKNVGVVGFGDIGKSVVKRLSGFDVKVTVFDPGVEGNLGFDFVSREVFPNGLERLDFLIFTCALNKKNFHMLDAVSLARLKNGCSVINVARGALIDEAALIDSLIRGTVASAALDVFEVEPLPMNSKVRELENCIFGSHNGSNTKEAVRRASLEALKKMEGFLYERT